MTTADVPGAPPSTTTLTGSARRTITANEAWKLLSAGNVAPCHCNGVVASATANIRFVQLEVGGVTDSGISATPTGSVALTKRLLAIPP